MLGPEKLWSSRHELGLFRQKATQKSLDRDPKRFGLSPELPIAVRETIEDVLRHEHDTSHRATPGDEIARAGHDVHTTTRQARPAMNDGVSEFETATRLVSSHDELDGHAVLPYDIRPTLTIGMRSTEPLHYELDPSPLVTIVSAGGKTKPSWIESAQPEFQQTRPWSGSRHVAQQPTLEKACRASSRTARRAARIRMTLPRSRSISSVKLFTLSLSVENIAKCSPSSLSESHEPPRLVPHPNEPRRLLTHALTFESADTASKCRARQAVTGAFR